MEVYFAWVDVGEDFAWSGEGGWVWVPKYFECMGVVGGIFWEGGVLGHFPLVVEGR